MEDYRMERVQVTRATAHLEGSQGIRAAGVQCAQDQRVMEPIICPWCGHEMTLVHLTGWFPPDIRNRYTCLHCMADAPCGTDEQDAYEKARVTAYAKTFVP